MNLIQDGIRLLLALTVPASLVALVLAGLALRREGTIAFSVGGGGFSKWMFWAIVMLTIPQLLAWFPFAGPLPGGGIGVGWMNAFRVEVGDFVTRFVITRLAPVLAAWLVLRSVLDVVGGGAPIPSILAAMFLLSVSATHALFESWNNGTPYATADILASLWTYTASRIMPIAAGLAIVGAILNFAAGKPALRLVGCAGAFLTVSALWRLVVAMM